MSATESARCPYAGVTAGLDTTEPYARTRRAVRWTLTHRLPRWALEHADRTGDPTAAILIGAATGRDLPATAATIRAQGRLVRGRRMYATASYDVTREVMRRDDFGVAELFAGFPGPLRTLVDWSRSSVALAVNAPPSMIVSDPPDHTRYRRLVGGVFSARAVEQLRQRVEEVAAELLDQLRPSARSGEPVDLMRSYAGLLPTTVIAEVLGVPAADRHLLLRFGRGLVPGLDTGRRWRAFRASEDDVRDFNVWLAGHIARVRRDPGDNLLSKLITAEDEGGRLTNVELRSVAGLVLGAGFVTTAAVLGTGSQLLMRNPAQLAPLRETPSLWPNAVEEIVRLESPVQIAARVAMRDTEVAGVEVPRGARVTMLLAAANRDPDVFARPDDLDVGRPNARDHLAFSIGRHFCLGSGLARMEIAIGIRMLFERFPELAPAGAPTRTPDLVLAGWDRMPVLLGAPA